MIFRLRLLVADFDSSLSINFPNDTYIWFGIIGKHLNEMTVLVTEQKGLGDEHDLRLPNRHVTEGSVEMA